MQDCITDCKACHDICMITIQHCLRIGGTHAEQRRLRMIADCSELSQTTANFMLRGSEHHQFVCHACAEICERCAENCSMVANGDIQMQACVEACRRCAVSCRAMAGEEIVMSGAV